jgi:probable rRNA maturation factor
MPGAHLPAGLEDWLVERLRAAPAEIDPAPTRVSVLIVDDATMTDLHRRHLGVDDTTDVLTFLSAGGPGEIDVATCIDEARRQAAHRGHPLEHELLLYALHGVLHGSGFDDRDEAGSAAMHAEEDRILRAIGVGPVFAGGPVARAPHRQGRSGG